jgi:hypothetical protein
MDRLEFEAGIDEDVGGGRAVLYYSLANTNRVFEGSNGCGADGDDAA